MNRDRDPSGRARNARPRDEFGRPMPYGTEGVERIDEDLVLPPGESLNEAQALLDAGRPFHAHEVLEGAWKSGPARERDLWKGLAQLAVGLTHLQRGNAKGSVSLLRRGAEHIGPFSSSTPHGVDVDGLIVQATELADRIEQVGLDAAPEPVRLQLKAEPGQ